MGTVKHTTDYSILIADDDDRCREALRAIMSPEGFRTVEVSSGEEAIDVVQEGVVFVPYNYDGGAVCALLSPDGAPTPVTVKVAVSA